MALFNSTASRCQAFGIVWAYVHRDSIDENPDLTKVGASVVFDRAKVKGCSLLKHRLLWHRWIASFLPASGSCQELLAKAAKRWRSRGTEDWLPRNLLICSSPSFLSLSRSSAPSSRTFDCRIMPIRCSRQNPTNICRNCWRQRLGLKTCRRRYSGELRCRLHAPLCLPRLPFPERDSGWNRVLSHVEFF